ncbi:Sec-independent protein translocase protein TatB [Phenylobacterium aquaticum]|uniref:Sec-independent protein translocase protein TatB n=1 Tax=Phenylobacterium aquaticum TaxID=1763816 RepID=UPI0026F33108|nr:Sec-independent protein translocase protein TatB [Phenylobacterium aquaticum]
MLPEVGGSELILIAVVALIVVGPKDLPLMLRKLGQFVAKLRGMAAEFRASFDEMARQSELDELRKEVEAMRRGQTFDMAARDAATQATGHGEVNHILGEIGDSLSGSGVQFHPPMSHQSDAESQALETTAPQMTPLEPPPLEIKAAKPPAKPRAKRTPTVEGGETPARKPRATKAKTGSVA